MGRLRLCSLQAVDEPPDVSGLDRGDPAGAELWVDPLLQDPPVRGDGLRPSLGAGRQPLLRHLTEGDAASSGVMVSAASGVRFDLSRALLRARREP